MTEALRLETAAFRTWDQFSATSCFAFDYIGDWAQRIQERREERRLLKEVHNIRVIQREAAEAEDRAQRELATLKADEKHAGEALEAASAQQRAAAERAAQVVARPATAVLTPVARLAGAQSTPRLEEARQPPVVPPPRPSTAPTPAVSAPGCSRRRCYYCGHPGVSKDKNCPNVANHDPKNPWFTTQRRH